MLLVSNWFRIGLGGVFDLSLSWNLGIVEIFAKGTQDYFKNRT